MLLLVQMHTHPNPLKGSLTVSLTLWPFFQRFIGRISPKVRYGAGETPASQLIAESGLFVKKVLDNNW